MGALIPLILLFVVMYAVMIRPQQRRAREHQALISAVEVGDEVMTTAGIFGTVTSIEDDVIGIEIAPGVIMKVARAAIGRRIYDEPEELDELDSGKVVFDDDDDVINVDEISSGGYNGGNTVPDAAPESTLGSAPTPEQIPTTDQFPTTEQVPTTEPEPGPASAPGTPGVEPPRGNGDVSGPGENP